MGSAETTSKRGPIGRAIYERKGRPLEGRYGEWANGRMGENGAFEDEDDDEYENEARSRYLLFEAVIGSRPLAVMAWVAAGEDRKVIRDFAASVVSAFLCAGRFLALLSNTLESCSNAVNWSRRDRLSKAVGSSRANCE
jgi:hypothetical protein